MQHQIRTTGLPQPRGPKFQAKKATARKAAKQKAAMRRNLRSAAASSPLCASLCLLLAFTAIAQPQGRPLTNFSLPVQQQEVKDSNGSAAPSPALAYGGALPQAPAAVAKDLAGMSLGTGGGHRMTSEQRAKLRQQLAGGIKNLKERELAQKLIESDPLLAV